MGKRLSIAAAVVAVLFCSCQSVPVVWDDSLPDEKTAVVLFVNVTITSYNGIGVTKFNHARIPAGETTMGGDFAVYHAGMSFRLKDMEFTFLFEQGKEYIVQGSSQEMLWGVSVYEASKYSEATAETRVAFIPFKNQPSQ